MNSAAVPSFGCAVPIVEDRLAVDVAQLVLALVLHHALGRKLGVQRRAGDGRVEHELVEVGVVPGGVLDGLVDVLRRVVFQADDRRAQHADAVRLQLATSLKVSMPVSFVYWLLQPSMPIHTQEMPRRTSCSMV